MRFVDFPKYVTRLITSFFQAMLATSRLFEYLELRVAIRLLLKAIQMPRGALRCSRFDQWD